MQPQINHIAQPSAASLAALRRVLLKGAAANGMTTSTSTGASSASASAASHMRWTPFSVFATRVVAMEVLREDTEEKSDSPAAGARCTSSNAKMTADELYNVVEYRWRQHREDTHKSAANGPCSDAPQTAPLVTLRERREAAGPSAQDIRIAHRDNIDNTGNFHWPTEDIMCRYLIKTLFAENAQVAHSETIDGTPRRSLRQPTTFLELGAGCGLAAFVLAASDQPAATAPSIRIVATDGNSRVMETLRRNVAGPSAFCTVSATSSTGINRNSHLVSPMHLPWQSAEAFAKVCDTVRSFDTETDGAPQKRQRQKILFGADCLFFEDFHADLATLIVRFHEAFDTRDVTATGHASAVSAAGTSPDGDQATQSTGPHRHRHPMTLLMAPSRGGSFERFEALLIGRLASTPFRCRRVNGFDVDIDSMHTQLMALQHSRLASETARVPTVGASLAGEDMLMAWSGQYNASRHYPMLLVVE